MLMLNNQVWKKIVYNLKIASIIDNVYVSLKHIPSNTPTQNSIANAHIPFQEHENESLLDYSSTFQIVPKIEQSLL